MPMAQPKRSIDAMPDTTRGMHDLSSVFNTPLPPKLETHYQEWANKNGKGQETRDYDLRGAFLAALQGDSRTKWLVDPKASKDQRGHLPDDWKKPNHPTFSKDSHYSGTTGYEGGDWQQGKDGKWTFAASPHNLLFQSPQQLQQYMARAEPDSKLTMPK